MFCMKLEQHRKFYAELNKFHHKEIGKASGGELDFKLFLSVKIFLTMEAY